MKSLMASSKWQDKVEGFERIERFTIVGKSLSFIDFYISVTFISI